VRSFYVRELGLDYPPGAVVVAGGARPLIYCLYRAVCDPGDVVVYPVPSWNNQHYVRLVGAVGRPLATRPERRFLPTREEILPLLPGARLLCLNSPLNPAGTVIEPDLLEGVCDAVLDENEARRRRGERPLYLLYDQIYWMLCFGAARHLTPPGVRPEIGRFSVLVDGLSKAFAATGLRVGWGVGPEDVMARMLPLLGHVGAWAPRPEQVATAELLADAGAVAAWRRSFVRDVQSRLDRLHRGLAALEKEGLPVASLAPEGAIYLSARIHPFGRRTPEGRILSTNEDVRRHLLHAASLGLVPFEAFGADAPGWFRLSVGAVGAEEIDAALAGLRAALVALR
jgi:aspartate aminotransferase